MMREDPGYMPDKPGGINMLWMKIVGCILIMCSTSGMGYLYAGEVKRRQEDLKATRSVALLLRGDIRYAQTPLPEAFENVAKRHEGRLLEFLCEVAARLKERNGLSFAEIWGQAESYLSDTSLTKKDKLLLHQLGESLGYLDKEMQLNTIDLFLSQTEESIAELSKEMVTRMRLYRSIGIMAGIFVVIIIL